QAEDIRDWFKRMPWRPGRSPLRWLPEYERYLLEQWSRGRFDESWQRPGLCASAHWDSFPDSAFTRSSKAGGTWSTRSTSLASNATTRDASFVMKRIEALS